MWHRLACISWMTYLFVNTPGNVIYLPISLQEFLTFFIHKIHYNIKKRKRTSRQGVIFGHRNIWKNVCTIYLSQFNVSTSYFPGVLWDDKRMRRFSLRKRMKNWIPYDSVVRKSSQVCWPEASWWECIPIDLCLLVCLCHVCLSQNGTEWHTTSPFHISQQVSCPTRSQVFGTPSQFSNLSTSAFNRPMSATATGALHG